MSHRHTFLLLSLVLNAGALRAQQTSGQACPAPFSSIALPNAKLIGAIQDGDKWTNPSVIVSADGYELILHGQPRSAERMSLAELRQHLVALPVASWPLGRVMAGSQNGLMTYESDRPIVARRISELRAVLAGLCVRFDQWPSS